MDEHTHRQQGTAMTVPAFRIWLCGTFRVERRVGTTYEAVRTVEWGGSSYPRLLLKALLCRSGRQARRDALLELLWPETEPEQAVHNLNTATSKLRLVLRPTKEQVSLLLTENDATMYRLPGQELLWVDADAALALLHQAERLERTASETLALLEEAERYFRQGPFQQEEEGQWVAGRRATVEQARYQGRLWLVEAYEHQKMPGQAAITLSTMLEEDPLDEDILCRLMALLHRQGMTYQALRLYEHACEAFTREGLELAEAIKQLAVQLTKQRGEMPAALSSGVPLFSNFSQAIPQSVVQVASRLERVVRDRSSLWEPERSLLSSSVSTGQSPLPLSTVPFPIWPLVMTHHSPLHVLCNASSTAEQQLEAWLALGTSHLGQLFEEGWTIKDIIDALQIILQHIQALPSTIQQHLYHLGGNAAIHDVALPISGHVSVIEQSQLCERVGRRVAENWKLFAQESTPLVKAVGQVQLDLLHRLHSVLPSSLRPLLYAGAYGLLGAAFFFQARYAEALQAHERAYLAGFEAGDAWCMAESLGWQSGIWKACGQQEKSINCVEAALRLLSNSEHPLAPVTRARLLAQWAESAALLPDHNIVSEKLTASAEWLNYIEPNDEFDRSIWDYYNGTCAFYLGNAPQADTAFQRALEGYPSHWLLQRANTVLFQAEARLKMGEQERALSSARLALPLVTAVNAPLLVFGYGDYLHRLSTQFPNNSAALALLDEAKPRLVLPTQRTVSRYLEATLDA